MFSGQRVTSPPGMLRCVQKVNNVQFANKDERGEKSSTMLAGWCCALCWLKRHPSFCVSQTRGPYMWAHVFVCMHASQSVPQFKQSTFGTGAGMVSFHLYWSVHNLSPRQQDRVMLNEWPMHAVNRNSLAIHIMKNKDMPVKYFSLETFNLRLQSAIA